MHILDLQNLQNSGVMNGLTSVSDGKVFLAQGLYVKEQHPQCSVHGAINKVSLFENGGGIWRCLVCNEGALQL